MTDTTNKSMADGIRIANEITNFFDNHDQLRTSQIQDKLSDDLTLQTLRNILKQLQEDNILQRVDARGEPSSSGQYWIQPPEESLARDTIKWTRELGLLDKPIDDDSLEPVEQLAHIFNTADWIDVQNNQQDTSLVQNHFSLKQQLKSELTTNE